LVAISSASDKEGRKGMVPGLKMGEATTVVSRHCPRTY